jgi:hypothetical protein
MISGYLRCFAVVVIGIFLGACSGHRTSDDHKIQFNASDLACETEKLRTLAAITEISGLHIRSDSPISDLDRETIGRIVKQIREHEEQIAFAKITRALRIHCSFELQCKDSGLVNAFDHAFWRSIEILAEDRSEENLQEMELLKSNLSIDGVDSYSWSTIVYRIPMP